MTYLRDILEEHKQKYNTMNIETNLDLTKREEFLYSIENYYKYGNLNDDKLREKLKDIGLNMRMTFDEMHPDSEESFALACRIEYWYKLTDEIKSVKIMGK